MTHLLTNYVLIKLLVVHKVLKMCYQDVIFKDHIWQIINKMVTSSKYHQYEHTIKITFQNWTSHYHYYFKYDKRTQISWSWLILYILRHSSWGWKANKSTKCLFGWLRLFKDTQAVESRHCQSNCHHIFPWKISLLELIWICIYIEYLYLVLKYIRYFFPCWSRWLASRVLSVPRCNGVEPVIVPRVTMLEWLTMFRCHFMDDVSCHFITWANDDQVLWSHMASLTHNVFWGNWRDVLTHWGQVKHICVSNLTIIGSDNDLSPYPGADQRKHQSTASLAFVKGIHRWPVNSPHKGPVTWKMFPFDDVIMTKP